MQTTKKLTMNTADPLQFIFGRRSIRVFKPGEVTEATVTQLLQAAMAAVEQSEQQLKQAVNTYRQMEMVCMNKSWSTADMDHNCKTTDTLQQCKEKLVTSCVSGQGADLKKLRANVLDAAGKLKLRTKGVTDVFCPIASCPEYDPNNPIWDPHEMGGF